MPRAVLPAHRDRAGGEQREGPVPRAAASGLVGCQPSSNAVASACSALYVSGSVGWAVGPVIAVSGTPPLYERVLRTLAR